MKPLDDIIEAARRAPRHIVLPEGEDPRIVEGACQAARKGIARITLLGRPETVGGLVMQHGARLGGAILCEDPASSSQSTVRRDAFQALLVRKGYPSDRVTAELADPLTYAATMVEQGEADGMVGGAIVPTARMVRTALRVLGPAPGVKLISSFFLMLLCEPHHPKKGALLFADCGLVVEPDSEELADIAIRSARSCEMLLGTPARVAMLSFSTNGSAAHCSVTKVVEATRIARTTAPDLMLEGELQFDAAFVESIGAMKAPGWALKGSANVFVFPNLDAANIGYKIAERIGGARAVGPILQGLAKPANDLSRGCSAEDVYHLIAVTCVQAAFPPLGHALNKPGTRFA